MTLDTYNTGRFLKIDNSDDFFMYESIKVLPTHTVINCPIMIGSLNFCDGTSLFYKLLENTLSRKNNYLKSMDLYACIGEVCYISLTIKNEQSLQKIKLNHVDVLTDSSPFRECNYYDVRVQNSGSYQVAVQCHLHIDFVENSINGFINSLMNVVNNYDENDCLANLSLVDFTGIDIFKYDKNNASPKWESFFETDRSRLKVYSLDNIEITSDIEKKANYTEFKKTQAFKMKGVYMPNFGKKILETCISNSKKEALENIPQNLEEAVKEIISSTKPEMIEKIKNAPEKNMHMFHFSSGMSIRNKWGLWQKQSPLYQYFNTIGIFHADDMSGIIMESVWRKIHNKPLELDEQVKKYRDYWQKHQPSVNEGVL